MLKRNGVVIDPNKSKEFCEFIRSHGKTKEFWDENAKIANMSVDDEELNTLFEGDFYEYKE